MFSTSDEGLVYQYHHTDALLANSKRGATNADADSIYRIGSISKLLTLYVFLIHDGDRHFNDPIADHVPELLQAEDNWNSITPAWNDITIGDLAGQMAGLARDFGLADLSTPSIMKLFGPAAREAFPELPAGQAPTCGYLRADGTFPACTLQDYIDGIASESPIFPAAYTPVYSNEAFALLGLALSKITGMSQEEAFNTALVDQLPLSGTSYTVPPKITGRDMIPGNPLLSNWNSELGVFGP